MEPTAVGRGRGSLHITGRICCARLHTTGSDLTSRPEDRVCICTSSDQAFVSTHPRTSLINHRHGFRNLLFFGLQATVLNYSSIFINAYSTLPYFFLLQVLQKREPGEGSRSLGRTLLSKGFKGP